MERLLLSVVVLLSTSVWANDLEAIPDKDWITAPNVVDFQPFVESSEPVPLGASGKTVTLVNLNRFINRWYLVRMQDHDKYILFNIENPRAASQRLALNARGQLLLLSHGHEEICPVLGKGTADAEIFAAAAVKDPYVSLCAGRLWLRQAAGGRQDKINWTAIKPAELFSSAPAFSTTTEAALPPPDALIAKAEVLAKSGNGFALDADAKGLTAGHWYKAVHFPGVYVSAIRAGLVAPEILRNHPSQGEDVVNLMAIDLDEYRFGWNNGTEHPGVGWSSRAQGKGGAGPDGFGNLAPLTFPGVVSPDEVARTVGVFTGGFQRHHSAFKFGPFHDINRSSHYGFMEKGVLMSTLIPNLASFIIYADGQIDLKTWHLADNARLNTMSDVRQNGLPMIEPGAGDKGVVNPLVNNWGSGNWSGSGDKKLKTPRTAACLVEASGKRYLLMTYFASHTPAGMVPVLLAYGCKYAIHLDMNQPVFAYSAFFTPHGDGGFSVEHLSTSMAPDTVLNGMQAPRWLLTPTYRDFFYVMKK